AWSAPMKITNDAGSVAHLFPQIFSDLDGESSLLWISTRSGLSQTYPLSLAQLNASPDTNYPMSALPAGYSHRITETKTPGIWLGVWVQGPEGEQDIYYRFFAMCRAPAL